jgi:hypothetical protein
MKAYRYVFGKVVDRKGETRMKYLADIYSIHNDWWNRHTNDPFKAWRSREKAHAKKVFKSFLNRLSRRARASWDIYKIEIQPPSLIID